MTNTEAKRRLQIVCAAFLHIPLVAIAAFALSQGLDRHISILAVALVATIISTLFIVVYIGRVLDPATLSAAR
jgi:phosphoglycerol transferase MdoB-like AlkP superfamily enzyme